MSNLIAALMAVAALGVVAWFVRGSMIRGQIRARLDAPLDGIAGEVAAAQPLPRPPSRRAYSIFRRHMILPWFLSICVGITCFYGLGLKLIFVIAIAIIVELLAAQLDSYLLERGKARIEQQLADGLDLIISTLRAGASVVNSMERAANEIKPPLKTELHSALNLIRYGDEPRAVLRRMAQRVPLESFRLFTTTLTVHFEVGGTLAPTLAVVGRIVRDRIEVARRIRSLTAQARVSTVALIGMTYVIAFLMWRHDPAGVSAFAASPIGSALIAGSMILQAVGIVWQSSMSRVRI